MKKSIFTKSNIKILKMKDFEFTQITALNFFPCTLLLIFVVSY
jgi:hypothetical protein